MTYPENFRYTKEHEWVLLEGEIATIGITDHAQSELGDIVYVDLPKAGNTFEAGKSFGSVESGKGRFRYLCAGGRRRWSESNDTADFVAGETERGPPWCGLAHQDWKVSDPCRGRTGLMTPAQYQKYVGAGVVVDTQVIPEDSDGRDQLYRWRRRSNRPGNSQAKGPSTITLWKVAGHQPARRRDNVLRQKRQMGRKVLHV